MTRRRTYDFADEAFLARLERLHIIAKRLVAGGFAGMRRSRRLGDGLEFADHRDYAPGDDIRFIDWPYYARMERLLLRLFHEHSDADVLILLDVSASMRCSIPSDSLEADKLAKFDYARRAVAALAYVAMGNLERVIIQPFGDSLHQHMHSARDRGQVLNVLDYLAGLKPDGQTDLRACVERLVRTRSAAGAGGSCPPAGRHVGTAVVISDLMDCSADLDTALARLAGAGYDATVLHIFTAEDRSPSLAGPMLLRDCENGAQANLNVTAELRDAYRKRFEAFCDACQHACVAHGVTYTAAQTDVPIDRLVLHTLRKAGVLAE